MLLSSRFFPVLLIAVLILAGCRTYGDQGYESGPKTYDAIQQILQQLEQDLGRAQSDLRRLSSVADTSDRLRGLADRYRTLVAMHETTLEEHRAQSERLSRGSDSRTLHRIYGAMITDRRLLQRQYERTTQSVWAIVRDTTVPRIPVRLASSYNITPVQYPETEDRGIVSMSAALRAVEGPPAGQEESGDE